MNEALPVVVISGHGTISTAVEATKKGAFDFIEKPFASERVLVSLRNALDQRQLRDENRTLKKAVEVRHQMIGESAALKQVMAAVGRAAPTNATVLIQGESGVGKELVARTIHRNSLRSRERFVQVNCAAIPEELIESELFGHEKGSFTGATEKQVGKFEQADRGTIFLDEVGDMSAEDPGQGAARAAGRRGRAARIGADDQGGRPRHRRDEQESRGGDREGTLPRGSVLPPRGDSDLTCRRCASGRRTSPLLVRHYMDYFSRENNVRPKRITQAALDALQRYRWKGNIRELRNTVERLIIMTGGDTIDVADLPDSVRSPVERRAKAPATVTDADAAKLGYAARVQGQRRARVSGRQAARERLEYLEDRRGDRHAAQQSVQEARAVPDFAGDRRLTCAALRATIGAFAVSQTTAGRR